jgi:hypothetical protein
MEIVQAVAAFLIGIDGDVSDYEKFGVGHGVIL